MHLHFPYILLFPSSGLGLVFGFFFVGGKKREGEKSLCDEISQLHHVPLHCVGV